ncbi:hypothetical protein [Devosia sp. A16]|uniref:hypothetical protein n=1 Tax=Devosia sp. A16 TaxID=1736675 RepID=UPI0006D7C19D|nr:hypothetical protein [Devosia sp. A16]
MTNPRGDVVDVDGFTASTLELGGALTAARTFAFGDGLELTPTVGIRAGVGGTGEDVGIDSTYAGLTAGMTLTGPGWTRRPGRPRDRHHRPCGDVDPRHHVRALLERPPHLRRPLAA